MASGPSFVDNGRDRGLHSGDDKSWNVHHQGHVQHDLSFPVRPDILCALCCLDGFQCVGDHGS